MTLRFLKPSKIYFLLFSFAITTTFVAAAATAALSQSLSESVNIEDWKKLLVVCSQRLSHNPSDLEALVTRARIISFVGKTKDSISDCNKALSIRTDYAPALYLRGALSIDIGNCENGKADLKKYLQLTDTIGNADVLDRRGHAYICLKDFKSAEREHQRILKVIVGVNKDPDLFSRADVFEHFGKFKEAEAGFSDLKRRHQRSPLVRAHLAYCYLENGKADLALKEFAEVAALAPSFAANYAAWGLALERQRKFSQAIQKYDRALQIHELNKFALEHRALCNSEIENYTLALNDLEKVIRLDPANTSTLLSRAYVQSENGFFKEAIADCKRVIAIDPKKAAAWYQLACAKAQLKEFKEAKAACEQALKLSPKYLAALCEHAWITKEIGDHKAACKEYDAVIRIDPKYSSAYYSRGYLFREDKQYAKAIADLTKAIELDPTNAIYFCSRGCARVRNQNYKEAIEDCTQSIKLNPNRGHPYYSRGEAYIALAKYDWAVKDFTSAIGTYSKYWEAYEKRAEAYKRLNKLELANRDLEKAKQLKLAEKS
jgi:tetratricopeptide (TPR) repeat protein